MIKFVSKPPFWVAAHRPIDFVYDYETINANAIGFADASTTSNTSLYGKMTLLMSTDFIDVPTVGQQIYIKSGTYKGYHTIAETNLILFGIRYIITNTDWTVSESNKLVKLITDHNFILHKGSVNPALSPYFPFEQIAEFKPEPNKDGLLKFNISGYVNKIFDVINSNDTALINNITVYYNLYNIIRLRQTSGFAAASGLTSSTHNVLNSSLTTFELNRDYVNTGAHINSQGNFYRSCGITNNIIIENGFVRADVPYDEGNAEYSGDFNNDFNNDFFRRT